MPSADLFGNRCATEESVHVYKFRVEIIIAYWLAFTLPLPLVRSECILRLFIVFIVPTPSIKYWVPIYMLTVKNKYKCKYQDLRAHARLSRVQRRSEIANLVLK